MAMNGQITNEQIMQEIADLKRMMLKLMQGMVPTEVSAPADPGTIALQILRAGDREGSLAYLKSLSSRRKSA